MFHLLPQFVVFIVPIIFLVKELGVRNILKQLFLFFCKIMIIIFLNFDEFGFSYEFIHHFLFKILTSILGEISHTPNLNYLKGYLSKGSK